MAYLTKAELSTHLYGEVTAEIDRTPLADIQGNMPVDYIDKPQAAIDAAVAEASSYMGTYDIDAVFAATGTARNPIILLYIKDLAVWHFIQLANPSVDMALRQDRYEKAIHFFEKVQSGKANPNLPYPAAPVDNTPPETWMKWGSNPKRQNNF